ncbi:MAG: GNAT family N-acetyltransferase [Prevotella sp.]|nr:GNAT family N-acetyltransferase [Prevotella sp.]MDY6130689.1 GNAT family N-acetyltransferase [Prevotella sp.]
MVGHENVPRCLLGMIFFTIFAYMNEDVSIEIVTQSKDLPEMRCLLFFHSIELFKIVEETSGQAPFMAIARRGNRIVGHLLAVIRRRGSLIPPYLFSQGRVYGEGEYGEGEDKEQIFECMLKAITQKLKRRMCLYIEFSNFSSKMFGYRLLRSEGYVPVRWMEIHISLHSMPPAERLSEKMKKRLQSSLDAGLENKEIETEEEFHAFYRLLRRFFSLKIRRYLPSKKMFETMRSTDQCKLFVTKYKEKVIGCSCCLYSGEKAYLWYFASKRKRYPFLHPSTNTVWSAIDHAHQQQYGHIFFMDVGLPFKKNAYRDFILGFGGKEVSKYRWFRFCFPWLNKIVGWFYRE